MTKLFPRRSTFTTVVAASAVLTVFGTGTAVAGGLITSAKIKNNTIQSIDVRNNNLTGADIQDASLSGADIHDASLTGADVANGSLSGTDIADGSLSNQDVGVLFAQIDAGGGVSNSSGGVSATHLGTGTYEVNWGRNVQSCAFVATQGADGVGNASGAILGVTDRLFDANAVFVTVHDAANAGVDLPFQIMAVC